MAQELQKHWDHARAKKGKAMNLAGKKTHTVTVTVTVAADDQDHAVSLISRDISNVILGLATPKYDYTVSVVEQEGAQWAQQNSSPTK